MIPESERRFEVRISEDGLKLWQCHVCGAELEWDENFWFREDVCDDALQLTLIACSEECKKKAEDYLDGQKVVADTPGSAEGLSPVKTGHGVWISHPKDQEGEEVTISFPSFPFKRKYVKTEEGKYWVERTGKTFDRQFQARRHLLKVLENDLLKALAAVRTAMEE